MAFDPKAHFLSTLDYEPSELRAWVDRALAVKRGDVRPDLGGLVGALLFFNPSVRTRLSCESALARFGGTGVTMTPGRDTWNFEFQEGARMDGNTQEHVRELAGVLSRMAHFVGVRRSELITGGSASAVVTEDYATLAQDVTLRALAEHCTVPVVNLESNRLHPMQGMADMATMVERLGDPRGERYVLTWAWHPKSLPVATPHSQLLAAANLGMNVTLCRPPGYELDPEVTAAAGTRAEALGGSFVETEDLDQALVGARVVCAKSWGALGAYGNFEEEARAKTDLRTRWIVDAQKMAATDDAFFMHCLPIRRNVIATDEVLDSEASAVIDEAENRLWTAAAVFEALVRRPGGV